MNIAEILSACSFHTISFRHCQQNIFLVILISHVKTRAILHHILHATPNLARE